MKVFCLCVWLLCSLPARTAAAPPALVVILLPGSCQDWQNADAPHLHLLMQTGAIAVMNTRTAHRAGAQERETPQSALLTLGAGSRAAAASISASFLPAESKAPGTTTPVGALFERRTGLSPHAGQSVCLDWPAVVKANTDLGYDLHLGALADTLAAHGYAVEAGGGPDADWVAAGSSGVVQHVSKLQAAPGLCLVWDAGTNITEADPVIAAAAAQTAALGSRLVVVSPYARDAEYAQNERLTPVLVWGKDVPAGLLLSPSTRQPGLVTNTDFAPSIADYFRIKRSEFRPLPFGFDWSAIATSNGVYEAARISRNAVQQARGMRLLPYLAAALGFWLLAATAAVCRGFMPGAWTLVPLAALAAALFAVSLPSFWILLPCVFGLTLALTRFVGRSSALAFMAAGVTLALIADLVTGNHLMQRSLLGHSAIEGARYYGIGNEAMGLLLGAALTAAAHFWSLNKIVRLAFAVFMGGIILLLGSAGAKAGGVLVSLAVFGTFLYAVSGRRWTGRTAILLTAVVAGGMALAALGDAFLMPSHAHSHIGEAVRRIASGGPGEAGDIIRRKLMVEGRLAYHSAWAILLWAGVLCTGILWKRTPLKRQPKGQAKAAFRAAGLVGIFACLLLNDAGVVAAAIFTALLWCEVISKKNLPVQEVS